jgi:hypothetical protein
LTGGDPECSVRGSLQRVLPHESGWQATCAARRDGRHLLTSGLALALLSLLASTAAAGEDGGAPAPPVEIGAPPAPGFDRLRISGFFVGSYGYNSALLIVPDAFGSVAAPTDPGRTAFRFDKIGLGLNRVFSSWLSVSAAVEAESHRDNHSHLVTPMSAPNRYGCPGGASCERFGAEESPIEVGLDRFAVTAVAPVGNGVALSLGRFDTPFGIERHDENLNLTATTSEVFRYARPQRMTGLLAAYAISPRLDVSGWVVNRWEAEDTGEGDFNDVNGAKSLGGRIGISPLASETLLNIGVGAWRGVERPRSSGARSLLTLDATWSPGSRTVVAAEAVRGTERIDFLRQVGLPVAEPAETDRRASWWGYSVVAHRDFTRAFGLSVRHALLDDGDRARTGVSQRLRSLTVAAVVHLSALSADLRPLTSTAPRTAHNYHWVDLKLEYRLAQSNRTAFGEALPNTSLHDQAAKHGHQVQLQVAVNF